MQHPLNTGESLNTGGSLNAGGSLTPDTRSNWERMKAGDWYIASNPENPAHARKALLLQAEYAEAYVRDPDATLRLGSALTPWTSPPASKVAVQQSQTAIMNRRVTQFTSGAHGW